MKKIMKTLALALWLIAIPFIGTAQWAVNGTNIYNTNADNVGIGTMNPGFKLDVQRFGNPQIQVKNTGGAAGATFRMVDQLSGADFSFKSTNTGGFKIRDNAFGMDVLFIESNSMANALYVKQGGHVGLGTTTPSADLHVNGTDGVLFTGIYGEGTIPAEGDGMRMMWYPGKGAFRVGYVSGTSWDDIYIGAYSFVGGYDSKATNTGSFAFGSSCEATGLRSFAYGYDCTSGGEKSFAFGHLSNAMGHHSFAFGNTAEATGNLSFAFGYDIHVTGVNSFAFGYDGNVSGNYSFLLGLSTLEDQTVTQDNTMAIMGGMVSIGSVAPERKFEVHDDRNSYVQLIKNDHTTIGDGLRITLYPLNPTSDNRYIDFMRNSGATLQYAGWICGNGTGGVVYSQTSDERLKMNIHDFRGGLEAVAKIQVRQYEMKDAPGIEQVGYIAQELINVFPEAVSGSPDDDVIEQPMGVDYGRITPLLVAAIQEQQQMIEELQARIERLEAGQTEHGSAGK